MASLIKIENFFDKRSLVISIVSHGHAAQVYALLLQLAALKLPTCTRVVLTWNMQEEFSNFPNKAWPFVLEMISNPLPQGFGMNHNKALTQATEDFLCVLNPDIEFFKNKNPWYSLIATAAQPGVGCAYPLQVDDQGHMQDSERALPTPAALWRRWFLRKADMRVDWVNAACMVLPRAAWESVGGFDDSYHMYCEDVDLCLRIQLAGLAIVRAPVQVVHAGQRASHRRWSHMKWHVRSLLRLWRSPVYRQARQMLLKERQGAGNIGSS